MKCESCKYYIKPTAVDSIIADLMKSSINTSQEKIIDFLEKFCIVKIVISQTGCCLYKKKWYMFWIRN